MQIYEELRARGLIAQVTDEDEIRELINAGKATFYIGFDATADSLHIGHFMALNLMRRLQLAGNRPIALLGGGTTMVGDPSGRTDMRQMLTQEKIQENAAKFKVQMAKFIDFSEGKALMLDNADWLLGLNYIELLRDVGAHFSVNNMLRAECYKQRMEKGLSFLEFNYMIMQSYDFYHMFKEYNCVMQCGGDDQWSNILGGTELIRRKLGKNAYGMTITLLLTSEGKKMALGADRRDGEVEGSAAERGEGDTCDRADGAGARRGGSAEGEGWRACDLRRRRQRAYAGDGDHGRGPDGRRGGYTDAAGKDGAVREPERREEERAAGRRNGER